MNGDGLGITSFPVFGIGIGIEWRRERTEEGGRAEWDGRGGFGGAGTVIFDELIELR